VGKYRALIDQLDQPDDLAEARDARKALVDADGRAISPLLHALRHHPSSDVRETVAEILGERKSWKAIPALIDALADECMYVRQDAVWSIEAICMLQPAALSAWLDLRAELTDSHDRVLNWWTLNKRFIENNDNLC
jgi:HEAT repeat protein